MKLRVFNTLSGQKEVFVPLESAVVKMYACGPTTYNFIHLGNARPLVVFDTIRRYLEYVGYEVIYVQNFTDVDHKILQRAQEEGISPQELAEKYIAEYFVDADALKVRRATVHPRVSENIAEIIAFVQGLIEKDYAYEIEGDVFFAVARFAEYGKLSKRTVADLWNGARIAVDTRKKAPGDFALWKKAQPGEWAWPSPWGQGRPGWHIECSAMSAKYLGPTFDIHAGGLDLIFPHHENEIAQSEALHGVPLAKYWLHNGFITLNQEKMSKSEDNFFLLREILKKYPAEVVRFYLLSTHYRRPLDFNEAKLEEAAKGLARLQTAWQLWQEIGKGEVVVAPQVWEDIKKEVADYQQGFQAAMADDFNTALALAVLFDFARSLNSWQAVLVDKKIDSAGLLIRAKVEKTYRELLAVLGLDLAKKATTGVLVTDLLQILVELRQEARQKKDYQLADSIREQLQQLGIVLEDTAQGVRWKIE